jgi:uncharacterized NAD(P)/FAD-binding protein YdhS
MGLDWRSVVDAMRPHTQTLWHQLPLAERRRFLRHARPYRDLHRHRIAPDAARQLDATVFCDNIGGAARDRCLVGHIELGNISGRQRGLGGA